MAKYRKKYGIVPKKSRLAGAKKSTKAKKSKVSKKTKKEKTDAKGRRNSRGKSKGKKKNKNGNSEKEAQQRYLLILIFPFYKFLKYRNYNTLVIFIFLIFLFFSDFLFFFKKFRLCLFSKVFFIMLHSITRQTRSATGAKEVKRKNPRSIDSFVASPDSVNINTKRSLEGIQSALFKHT